jgi:hypothetical protein
MCAGSSCVPSRRRAWSASRSKSATPSSWSDAGQKKAAAARSATRPCTHARQRRAVRDVRCRIRLGDGRNAARCRAGQGASGAACRLGRSPPEREVPVQEPDSRSQRPRDHGTARSKLQRVRPRRPRRPGLEPALAGLRKRPRRVDVRAVARRPSTRGGSPADEIARPRSRGRQPRGYREREARASILAAPAAISGGLGTPLGTLAHFRPMQPPRTARRGTKKL